MGILSYKYKILGLTLLISTSVFAVQTSPAEQQSSVHNQWLKDRFGEEHQKLIPVVAVADIFFACNIDRKTDVNNYKIKNLITDMDRDLLAEKLSKCLKDEPINSDNAINYGLHGCFHDQLLDLPMLERQQKMKLVQQAIASLSKEERIKSFTQCVSEQAINYLSK